MSRLSSFSYDASAQTITIGAGLRWDDVYAALDPLGLGCLGGRTPGIGVGGFMLGGGMFARFALNICNACITGYSWHTNQYGLSIDTVVGYELVLPGGDIVTVTNQSYPDLFFGLKVHTYSRLFLRLHNKLICDTGWRKQLCRSYDARVRGRMLQFFISCRALLHAL